MLAASEVSTGYHDGLLFEGVSLKLHAGDRVGVVGPNGVGKSTLLRVLGGKLQPETGAVVTDSTVGFLEQTPNFAMSVWDYMDESCGGLLSNEQELQSLYEQMGTPEVDTRVGELQASFEAADGWNARNYITTVLSRLGAPPDAMQKSFDELSGGEQSRIMLAGQLIREPDILLLDEPTNNLDQQALEWLEGFMDGYRGAIVVVSHDRTFLDNTVHSILEIDGSGGTPEVYQGGYTAYREEAARQFARKLLDYEAQEKDVRRTTATIARQTRTGSRFNDTSVNDFYRRKASLVDRKRKALQHRLERTQQSDDYIKRPEQPRRLPLHLSGISTKGKKMIGARALTLSYGVDLPPVIQDATFTIHGKDRVAVLGDNGVGKTTLLSVMARHNEDLIQSGRIEASHDAAYLAQTETQRAVRASSDTVIDWFRSSVGGIYEEEATSLLVWFGFEPHQIRQQVKTLSPGEVQRLVLLGMTYSGKELLLLDEPTNHLDFDALDITEHVLGEYRGTLIVVSHDRAFLSNIGCNRLLTVANTRVTEHEL